MAITHTAIRIFLRDTDPEANELLCDYEFTDEELTEATQLAIDKWNETPPPVTTYTRETFPYPYHLKLMVAANLLTIASFRLDRNHLQYNAGGVSVNDQSRGPAYVQKANQFTQQFDQFMHIKKAEENLSQCWGSV